jgi:cellulose synthase/poly-beta-1,6-N-acetylglucosamine synthase-like glycosyltransferase
LSSAFPLVSILLAARNEEENIANCLRSLAALSYPKERLQILIGDDDSSDQTGIIIQSEIAQSSHFQYILIEQQVKHLRGKANILAQLAEQAEGEFLFFTDADMELPTHWIEEMLICFEEKTGIVTGITTPKGDQIFDILQSIDWLYNLYGVHILSSWNIPVTAMGNNMAVRRNAYEETGGYESIKFSVTEDYDLFCAIVQKGWGFKNLFHTSILGLTKAMSTWEDLTTQRVRWMKGAFRAKWYLILLWMSQTFFSFLMILGFVLGQKLCLWLLIGRYLIRPFWAQAILKNIQLKYPWYHFFLYEIYQDISGLWFLAAYATHRKITWKSRTF